MVREGLAALVQNDPGLQVVGQCGEGLAVVEQVRQCQPDVVVLDITLPGLNGLDICREITRKFRKTVVLILTMHDDEQLIAQAIENGASGYLLKEAAGRQLTEAIRTVSRGELYLGPGIPTTLLQRMTQGEREPYDKLTMRERQVLQMVAESKTNRQIADELKLSIKTVDTHRSHLMRKLNIHDQTTLVKYALRKGIISLH
jgi:DNA-binding NarL/FixJ family response regulator